MKILLILLLPLYISAQTYVGFNAGNINFETEKISIKASVIYQPTIFGLKTYYFSESSFGLQTTIDAFRNDIVSPVLALGYDFKNNITSPTIGISNQLSLVDNVWITVNYDIILPKENKSLQYISFGVIAKLINPKSKPRFF